MRGSRLSVKRLLLLMVVAAMAAAGMAVTTSASAAPDRDASLAPVAMDLPGEASEPSGLASDPSPSPDPRPASTAAPPPAPAPAPAPAPVPPPPPPAQPPAAPQLQPSGEPGPATTGVPDGTVLRQYNGDMTITQDGTVIDGMDIHGFVDVRASNVTIRNSIIRGSDPGQENRSLISAYGDHVNLVVQDATLAGAVRSNNLDGLKGKNFTAVRLDISGVVDTVQILGDNSTVRDSWLHDNLHLPDTRRSGGYTHDDSIQIEGGRNILVQHNSLNDAENAAVMITQNVAGTSDVDINANWISGGGCSINVDEKGRGPIQGLVISNNVFGTSQVQGCAVLVPTSTPVTLVGNVWAESGRLVAVTRP